MSAALLLCATLTLHNAELAELNQRLDDALAEAGEAQQVAEQMAAHAAESEQAASDLLYASDLKLAAMTWHGGDHLRARDLLLRHAPPSGEPDERDFEWHYLEPVQPAPARNRTGLRLVNSADREQNRQ